MDFKYTLLGLSLLSSCACLLGMVLTQAQIRARYSSPSSHELFDAIKENNLDKVKTLLPEIDINTKDRRNHTPLTRAIRYRHTQIAEYLLKQEGIKLSRGSSKKSPMELALKYGEATIFELLKKKQQFSEEATRILDVHLENALNNKNNSKESIAYLIKQYFNQTSATPPTIEGTTLLHWAAQQGDIETAALILKKGGVCINAVDNKGKKSLNYAIENKNSALIKLLMEHGAKVDEYEKAVLFKELAALADQDAELQKFIPASYLQANRSWITNYRTPLFLGIAAAGIVMAINIWQKIKSKRRISL